MIKIKSKYNTFVFKIKYTYIQNAAIISGIKV